MHCTNCGTNIPDAPHCGENLGIDCQKCGNSCDVQQVNEGVGIQQDPSNAPVLNIGIVNGGLDSLVGKPPTNHIPLNEILQGLLTTVTIQDAAPPQVTGNKMNKKMNKKMKEKKKRRCKHEYRR